MKEGNKVIGRIRVNGERDKRYGKGNTPKRNKKRSVVAVGARNGISWGRVTLLILVSISLTGQLVSRNVEAKEKVSGYVGGTRRIYKEEQLAEQYQIRQDVVERNSPLEYIKHVFGKNWETACMVAYGESLRNTKGINSSPVEYSVGVFQINLARGYGLGEKVHWDKVQGSTLEEKTEWLQNWKNNIDLAHVMSNGGTNWGQWSAFSNSSYLLHEGACK